MKKLIMIGVYGLLILGGAAGGTWFLRQRDLDAQAAKDAEDVEVSSLDRVVDVTQPLPPEESKDLPVAVRPGEMSVEEIVRYGLGLKAREAAIREREDALRRTETQHRLVLADIEGEQKEVEGLLAQARDQRKASEALLTQANQQKMESQKLLDEAEMKKVESEKMMKQMETRAKDNEKAGASAAMDNKQVDREANIKNKVELVQGMAPETASAVLREWSNNGKMDEAVEVLSKLEARKASSILDAMNDEKLVSELLAKFDDMKRTIRK